MKVFFKVGAVMIGLCLIAISLAALSLSGPLSPWAGGPVASTLGALLGAPVALDSFRFVPEKLGVEIRGLRVENPPDFEKGTALRVERILVQPHLAALFSDTVQLRRIKLEEPELRIASNAAGETNLVVLERQAQGLMAAQPSRVFASRVEVGTLTVRAPGQERPIMVPAFDIKDLGGGQPMPPSMLGALLLRQLSAHAFQSAGIDIK